jgi:aminodeoxyfutalosine synthase
MTTSTFDQQMDVIAGGGRLAAAEIRELAATPDILALGMLGDALRRRLHGSRTTYLRVASVPFEASFAAAVPPAAQEVRLTGVPGTLAIAASAVGSARAVAGTRTVSGFTWSALESLAAGEGGRIAAVLTTLRGAGLDAVAELPLDTADVEPAIEQLRHAGFERIRLTVDTLRAAERTDVLLRAAVLQERFNCIQSINPLPLVLGTFRPTTGYEDVKMVAIARLAAPAIPSVQVDWQRYGPKLAQVALTFGADDIDGVSPSDEAPEGRRRAPHEEIRRNIEAAGFEPVERTGAFTAVA